MSSFPTLSVPTVVRHTQEDTERDDWKVWALLEALLRPWADRQRSMAGALRVVYTQHKT